VLLAAVPLVDLVLLVATVLDLQRGAVATAAHGLAAAYIAFSVAFGHRTIRAMDARVAHRFAGGPAPEPTPRRGAEAVRHAWQEWRRALLAWSIAVGLLAAAVLLVGDVDRTRQLTGWIAWLSGALVVWFLAGPLAARLVGRRLV
jgi:hypothetical protein